MKKIIIAVFTVLVSITAFGQDITGQWNGVLKVPGMQLRLVFNISKTDNGLMATMDSPDQGAKGIPTTSTTFENSSLKITIANAKIEYEGVLGNDQIIVGTFKQSGQTFPLNLSKEKIDYTKRIDCFVKTIKILLQYCFEIKDFQQIVKYIEKEYISNK